MQDDINQDIWTVKLGDWSNPGGSYYHSTRTSDFITSHFRAFFNATSDARWTHVLDNCYALAEAVRHPQTGLVPDFIVEAGSGPTPAAAGFLEGDHDGHYYYNACRFPLRIGTDYLVSGDNRPKNAVNAINGWLSNTAVGDISSGYELDGTAINTWHDAAFIGPLTVGAMASGDQERLDALYEELQTLNSDYYYSDTLKLLSLIVVSGNYWNP